MKSKMTAGETLRAFCHTWFELRDSEKTLDFFTDQLDFVGTGDDESAHGKEEMREYLLQDIQEIPEPFICEIGNVRESMIVEDVHKVFAEMVLRNSLYSWRLRCFLILVDQEGEWRIQNLHFAEPAKSQIGDEHYPKTLVVEKITRQRQELLNDSLPGGMMGGYIEPEFPFYFINRQMLNYLGYSDEKEFVAAIGGKISNCMHPDDRDLVDQEVARQLQEKNEYVVEYRMRKKDGTYIWVHDLGRQTTAEDGRAAISSVCIDVTDQKMAREEVLRIYNNIPGAVFRCCYDEGYTVIEANDGLFEFLGYSREEFMEMGNQIAGVIVPEDRKGFYARMEQQLSRGDSFHDEVRLVCKGGAVKWISIKAQCVQEKDDDRSLYCVFVDITDEKRLQERVKELYEQELAYFTELASAERSIQGRINVTRDQVENYMSSPDVAVAKVGNTYRQMIENLALSAVDPVYGDMIRKTLNREQVLADYAAGHVDYHFDYLRKKNGSGAFWSNTNLRSCLNPETGDVIVFFYTFDVTEQKLQELLLGKIAELDYDVITEIDIRSDAHRVLSFKDDQENVIPQAGNFQESIRRIAELYMDDNARAEYLSRLDYEYMKQKLDEQDSYSFVLEMKDGGEERLVKRFKVFYIDRDLGRVCMARTDVTEVVRKEQHQKEQLASALVAAEQANAAKTDFLSRMSHEIRTPMNAIIGMSTIAAQSIGDDEQVADCISKIGISSRFLLSLINDILDMSRIESGKMLLKNEKIPTEDFLRGINSICYSQAASKGVEYECILDPVLDDYYIGDAMKLQQVLINILSNAIKFTGEGGKITFSASQRRRTRNDAVLRFVVNDTGVGMSEEFIPHIFEPFSQESTGTTALYGGTGLGLAISKNIVDMMDGRITVRSIRGIGSEFIVDVKLGLVEEEKLRHNQKKQNYNFSHLKTLVVDDDVAVCESAIVTLREMGVAAEWVDSGRKAIERVEELWNSDKYFDMILIDWKMPEMDGIETARRIRRIVGPDVTIIIMTAYDWISIENEAKLAGVNLLMSKPMFKSSLVSAFTKALGQKEEEASREDTENFDFKGKRVLVVEDHPMNTEIAVMLLKSKGFEVETAENGLRAIELYSKTEAGYYDAILMDIRMPLMDGLAAANNIRHLSNADAKTIPIIAMTANAFDDDIEKSKAAGMNAHLAKPIEPDRLYQTLYDFIFGKEE